jgi:hypothetical protein
MESFEVKSHSPTSQVTIKLTSPYDFLRFMTRDFKELKKKESAYFLEWDGEISGSNAHGRFPIDYSPQDAKNLVSLENAVLRASIKVSLPNLVRTLDTLS